MLKGKGRPKKASSLQTDKSNVNRHILPLIGRLRARSVTQKDIEDMQRDIAAGKTAYDEKTRLRGRAIVKGGKGVAARCVAILGAIFTFAIRQGYAQTNPVKGVATFCGAKKERFLIDAEYEKLGKVLKQEEQAGTNLFALTAIRILMTTGLRRSEILELQWDYIDWKNKLISLPDSKVDRKSYPLNEQTLALLKRLPRIENSPFVFPSSRSSRNFVGIQKIWQRIRRKADLNDVRLNDIRHSFASLAVSGGESLYKVSKLLGHEQLRTTQRYAHLAPSSLHAASSKVAGKVLKKIRVRTH